jgi:pimeloyl-ACP methyl ester carboxylesterase
LQKKPKRGSAPVLYLYGTDTDFPELIRVNAQFFETYLPTVRMVGLEGGIHDLAWQKPQEVAALIMDFFGEQTNEGLFI